MQNLPEEGEPTGREEGSGERDGSEREERPNEQEPESRSQIFSVYDKRGMLRPKLRTGGGGCAWWRAEARRRSRSTGRRGDQDAIAQQKQHGRDGRRPPD